MLINQSNRFTSIDQTQAPLKYAIGKSVRFDRLISPIIFCPGWGVVRDYRLYGGCVWYKIEVDKVGNYTQALLWLNQTLLIREDYIKQDDRRN